VTVVLAGLQSIFDSAWKWLYGQLATVQQAVAPAVAHAAPPAGAAFRSDYFAGNTRIAMRVEGDPTADGLYFFLRDHLGSTTVTLKRNGDGSLTKVGELRYNPWGKERASGFDGSLTLHSLELAALQLPLLNCVNILKSKIWPTVARPGI
jgi:hypothetical protein